MLNEPPHDKTNKMTVRPAKTDQPGHPPSLIRVFVCAQWVSKDPSFLHTDSEDSDQTGRIPRLVWVFAGRTVILFVLSWGGSNLVLQTQTFGEKISCVQKWDDTLCKLFRSKSRHFQLQVSTEICELSPHCHCMPHLIVMILIVFNNQLIQLIILPLSITFSQRCLKYWLKIFPYPLYFHWNWATYEFDFV